MPNYGQNAYHDAAIEILGPEYAKHIASVWGMADDSRDTKLSVMLQIEILKELRKLNQSLSIPPVTESLVTKAKVVLKPTAVNG